MPPLTCRIVVRGELDDRFESRFLGLSSRAERGRTVLWGVVADQAQLRGLLERLFDLGIEVVSVETTARAGA